jgi:D-alanyl-D-alanine carboxypeptidase
MRVNLPLPDALATPLVDAAKAFGIPGMGIVLAAPGRRSTLLYGVAQEGTHRAVDAATWFSVASLGKHITAAAVLDLASRGLVDLSAPIGRYLADLPTRWADRRVEALLHHTSGLPEYLAHHPGQPVPETRTGFISTYGALVPAFGQDEAWMYTNTNYILAGMLVAQIEGQPFAAAVQALLDRAGCRGAMVGSPSWVRGVNTGEAGTHDGHSATREVIGDGDVCFTPAGAAVWLEALLDGPHEGPMFRPAPQVTGRPAMYGCGWFLEPLREGMLAHHGGHFDGWTAMAILHPGKGTGVIAMCNQAPGHTRHIRHLAQAALEAFCPGSTPLSLPAMEDDDPGLTARLRRQLFREPGSAADPDDLADELRRVAEHGSAVRTVPNLNAGTPPERFELVERQPHVTHCWHRYRLTYPNRVEHVFVGTTTQGRTHWAWAL